MGTIKIVTDSSITIEPELIEALDITVVPLSVMVDSKLYSDNDLKEEGYFLSLMKASKSLPKTSQPPVGLFAETYENLVNKGATNIVAIHLSPALSGTIEASRQGAEIAEAPVAVLDSGFTDQAMKFQVVEAAKLAQAGASLEEILAAVQAIKSKTELYIGVSTLENLVKGGRIGRVTGVLSSLLNVRVVMELKNDELKTLVKGRGNKTFIKWLDSYLAANNDRSIAEVAISYAGEADLAMALKEKIATQYDGSIPVLETGSIIQTHTGEGAFAVMVRYE
ncbi:UNVERIFIED_CONTAM: DegV family protein [Streptococcus canis]|uniref:DegV family protein n=1 Tax=Streptococcus canis TaxID=1329 RepID=UPI000B8B4C72|nr:DegV family protein [Streptococcus canis]MDW7797279.1 DegV family protein [Streptococcus canis]QJD12686.1 DegV family protein [Streptococcus canis]QKG73245.1 DegV family protein [Streptococcus canis]VTR80325.1 degV family protein [Streptococcus canis]